jgi:biopolymer transport protein ExbD
MPIKHPEIIEGGLNMTPMIDIVFNLVTFFMLTLDMSHKDLAAVDLPRAWSGIEDKDPAADKSKTREESTRFTINLEADGDIYFKGQFFKLTDPDPAKQDLALENLRRELRTLTGNPKLRNPDGSSKVMVLVRGDRTSKWKYIQWIMQVCADPTIKIWQIHFAVEHPKPNE